jgi:acyl dehydratase
MPTVIAGAAGLHAAVGADLGATDWKPVPFSQIQAFADATGDHQWIHVDRERIAKESPYGAPIAHGYLSLSMVAPLFFELLDLQGFKMVINYGTNKVRFPTPVKAEARTRMSLKLTDVKPAGEWLESVFVATIEVEGSAKPACVAECVFRFLPG